jgi:spermidine/putrescine-binding protein
VRIEGLDPFDLSGPSFSALLRRAAPDLSGQWLPASGQEGHAPDLRPLEHIEGTTVLALLLTACGGDDGDGTAADVACGVGEVDGDLSFYNWSDYMDPDLVAAFEEEYDVTVTQDFYPSNEELFARVEAGGAQYDVIIPSDYMVDIMIQEDLLLALDFDAIPNAANIDDDFAQPPYDPDLAFSVPYQWGTTGIGVNLDVVGEDVEPSWDLLFDEAVAS